ncbi:F-box protein CPR1-like [Cornus florida]|uniref:F-box protein CPR1-like n=1 Tax=Cornus florida TaxID=4283 RepID=UPI0028A19F7B|nr:F-box protein CPR1-like [Cornus florida]
MAGVNQILKKFRALACSSRRKRRSNIPNFLPKEIIFNILVFLPADILYNVMRYVCREWYNIINNPHFINAHLQKSTKSLLVQDIKSLKVIDLVETNSIGNVCARKKLRYGFSNPILSSCDGLVLFRHDDNDLLFCVANLITKQMLTLPPSFQPIGRNSYSTVSAVLYYAHSIKRYKVVHVFFVNHYQFKCEILNVGGETSWRLIDTNHNPTINLYFLDLIGGRGRKITVHCAGGYLYWTLPYKKSTYLLAMNVEDETMHQVPYPMIFEAKRGYFVARESFLTLMIEDRNCCWEVRALTDLKTREWTRLFNVHFYGQRGMLHRHLVPHVWLKNGELVIFQNLYSSKTYIVYNIKTREVTSFLMGERDMGFEYHHHEVHVNSLVSLKGR